MPTKPSYWLIVIVIFTISCDRFVNEQHNSDMTAMTNVPVLFNILNQNQPLSPNFLDSAMVVLDNWVKFNKPTQELSLAYRDLGWRNNDLGRYGTALIAFDKSLNIAKSANAVEEEIETNLALARLFNRFIDYNRSKAYYEAASNRSLSHTNLQLKLNVLHEQAKNELIFKNYATAEAIARAGLMFNAENNLKERINLLNALGLSLLRQNKYMEGKRYFEEALALDSLRGKTISGFLFGNLAECYIQLNRYQEAEKLLLTDYNLSLADRSFNSAYGAALSLSELYLKFRKPQSALYFFNIADSLRIIHNFEDINTDEAKLFLQITRLLQDKNSQLSALEKYTTAQEKWIRKKDRENKEQITALISINEALQTIDALRYEKEQSRRFNFILTLSLLILAITFALSAYIFIVRNKRIKDKQRLADLEIQSKNQQLTLLQQAKELDEKQILLQQAEAAKKENDLALLRSRTEHQALAKEYYLKLKQKIVDIVLSAVQNMEKGNGLSKQLERALLEVNLLDSNPFIDSVSQNEESSEFLTKLGRLYPELTNEELKLCTFLKLNMSTKEIADIKSITIAGVNKSRNRIRKKFGLKPEQNLYEFLNQIG